MTALVSAVAERFQDHLFGTFNQIAGCLGVHETMRNDLRSKDDFPRVRVERDQRDKEPILREMMPVAQDSRPHVADADAIDQHIAGGRRRVSHAGVLMLVEFDGLTQQAAAKRMGLSLSGMKSRVQRGRQQLKRKLDECCLIQLDGRHAVADYTVRDPKRPPC